VPHLDGPASSFQHSWVVSEHGRAAVWPQSAQEQTRQIVEQVAHPDVRPSLRQAAIALGLRPGEHAG